MHGRSSLLFRVPCEEAGRGTAHTLPGAVPDIQGSKQASTSAPLQKCGYPDIWRSIGPVGPSTPPTIASLNASVYTCPHNLRMATSIWQGPPLRSAPPKRCQLRTASLESFVAFVSLSSAAKATGPGAARPFVLLVPHRTADVPQASALSTSLKPCSSASA